MQSLFELKIGARGQFFDGRNFRIADIDRLVFDRNGNLCKLTLSLDIEGNYSICKVEMREFFDIVKTIF